MVSPARFLRLTGRCSTLLALRHSYLSPRSTPGRSAEPSDPSAASVSHSGEDARLAQMGRARPREAWCWVSLWTRLCRGQRGIVKRGRRGLSEPPAFVASFPVFSWPFTPRNALCKALAGTGDLPERRTEGTGVGGGWLGRRAGGGSTVSVSE